MINRRHLVLGSAALVATAASPLVQAKGSTESDAFVKSADIIESLSSKDIVLDQPASAAGRPGLGQAGAHQRRARHPQRRPGAIDLRVQFALQSAEVLPAGRRQLDELAQALQSPQLAAEAFEVIGHTDQSGTLEFNLALSEARAQAAKAYLMGRHGVAGERLLPQGRGYAELIDPQHPSAAINRRVEVRRAGRRTASQ